MRRRARRGSSTERAVILSVLLAIIFSWDAPARGTDGEKPAAGEGVLAAIRECMARDPAPWPDVWRKEYEETIRRAMVPRQDVSQVAGRLQILQDGFALYWPDLKNSQDRSQFEVRRAQIRWYVENLMASALPGPEETSLIRRQFEDLAEYAAQSLLAQFSVLDPNSVHQAKADYMADCRRRIDVPLEPVYLTPLSTTQIDRIKQRWYDLRYARVDLWRQLRGGRTTSPGNQAAPPGRTHPDYLLMQRSLDQWQPYISAVAATAPEYYQAAAVDDLKAQRQRLSAISQARRQESRLGLAVRQTEYFGFLLGALLETARDKPSELPGDRDDATLSGANRRVENGKSSPESKTIPREGMEAEDNEPDIDGVPAGPRRPQMEDESPDL